MPDNGGTVALPPDYNNGAYGYRIVYHNLNVNGTDYQVPQAIPDGWSTVNMWWTWDNTPIIPKCGGCGHIYSLNEPVKIMIGEIEFEFCQKCVEAIKLQAQEINHED
jgi:hypothetical protein